MKLRNLETPSAVVDLDAFDRNVDKMLGLLAPSGLKLRPHYKSFKSIVLAHMLMERGAKGFITAKISEAEDLIEAGFEDILIGNQVTDPRKIARLAYLAGCCRLTVCVDDLENVHMLSKACTLAGTTLYCLVEYDVGMNRCGVFSQDEFIALAKEVDSAPGLVFEGIQAYAGNLAHEFNTEVRKACSLAVEERVKALKTAVENAGLSVKEVSGISTGTLPFHLNGSVYTEVQTGSFLFGDRSYRDVGTPFEQSLYLLTSVISARPLAVIFDCGVKSLGMDQRPPYFKRYPEIPIEFSEEHSALYFDHPLKTGDKLFIVPGHCCTTVNLQDKLYLYRGDTIVDCVPVTGRGKAR